MSLSKSLCSIVLLTAAAAVTVQPALAAEAQAAKPRPVVESLQIVDVPARGGAAEASESVTTARDHVGFRIEELFEPKMAACPPSGNATFTWTITDGCADGVGILVRFFDETNNLVFPNSTQAYVVNSGRSSTIKLTVKRGAKICYGAEPSDLDGLYWGVALDNAEGCSNCCNIVPNTGNTSRSVRLIC